MKYIFTLCTLLCVATSTWAQQLPNPSFETWTGNEPNEWTTNNLQATGAVTRSNNGHAGSAAVQLNVVSTGSGPYNTLGGKITTGDSTNNYRGFRDTVMPGTLSGWYILNPVGGDFITVNSSVYGSGVLSAFGIIPQIGDTAAVYKQFSLTFNNPGNTQCDTMSISIQLANTNSTPVHVGTTAIVDDLTWTSYVGIEEVKNTAVLEPCSPNPASNIANIIYSIVGRSTVSVELYDITGNKVKTLLDKAVQTEGRYKLPTDVSNLESGMYFYRLTVDGQTLTQKLVVAK